MKMRQPIAERFWAKVDKNGPIHPVLGTPCWLWRGARTKDGYGQLGSGGRKGRMLYAHRVAWELTHGPLAEDEQVLHRCDNPPCENPDHLFKGTHSVNMRDRDQKGRCRSGIRYSERKRCKNGHEFTPENTRARPEGQGRACRTCERLKIQRRRREAKAA